MAWSFDEVDDRVAIADAAPLSIPAGDWTVGGWYYLPTNVGTQSKYMLSWGSYSSVNTFNFLLYEASHASSGRIELAIESANGTDVGLFPSSTLPAATGVWHHVTAWRSGDNFTLAVDGSNLLTVAAAAFNGVNRSDTFYVGGRSDLHAERYFLGRLAEWFKVDRALTAQERSTLLRGGSPVDLAGIHDATSWYLPMYRDRYQEWTGRLALTNAGSTGGAHAPVRMPFGRHQALFIAPVTFAAVGTLAVTLDDATFSGTATATIPASVGTLAVTTQSATFSATATATVPGSVGTLAVTVDDATFAGTATADVAGSIGTLAVSTNDTTFSGTATAGIAASVGTLTVTTDDTTFTGTATASGTPPSAGTLAVTLDDATFAGTVEAIAPASIGTLAVTLDDAFFSGTATATTPGIAVGTLAVTTDNATFAGTAESVAPASVGTLTATTSATFTGTADATTPGASVGSLAVTTDASSFSGTAIATIPASVGTLTATTEATFAGSAIATTINAVGTLDVTTDDATFDGSGLLVAAIARQRGLVVTLTTGLRGYVESR